MWPTQIWWPQLLRILIEHPVALPQQKNLLSLPNSNKVHPLQKKMVMMACYISGDHTRQEEFQNKPSRSSWRPGALRSGKIIYFISKIGRLLGSKKNQSKSFKCRAGFGVPRLSLWATVVLSCSISNTDRSSLSSYLTLEDGISLGHHPLVTRLLKGIFQSKPQFFQILRHMGCWCYLVYIKGLSPVETLTLKDLNWLVMLIMLVSARMDRFFTC